MAEVEVPKPPPPLPSSIRLIVALAALCATQNPPHPTKPSQWLRTTSTAWLKSVCKLLSFDPAQLPPSITAESVRSAASEQKSDWSDDEIVRIAGTLVEASLAVDAEKRKKEEALTYDPIAKALSHWTLELLDLDAKVLLPEAEKNLSTTLFKALQAANEGANEKVESTRAAHSQGWGGSLGRTLATGAGVIAGGVLIGITGGLAAPAIAAVLAPLGIGGLIGGAAAPVVLGTLFGVGGGGLAGRRVRERWRGVEEFSFVEVGAGTKATQEEIDDLRVVRERTKAPQTQEKETAAEKGVGLEKGDGGEKRAEDEAKKVFGDGMSTGVEEKTTAPTHSGQGGKSDDAELVAEVERDRHLLEEKLLSLSIESGARTSVSANATPRTSIDSTRASLDSARPSLNDVKDEKDPAAMKKPPSLTATIVVPGLLTVSKTEAITAWRAICSSNVPTGGMTAPVTVAREKDVPEPQPTSVSHSGLKDGRDVYLLRFESTAMLKTGRDIDLWVTSKIKGKIKQQIIKRTVLSAYFAAVALPMSVYSMATMSLDNTWMQAQNRASKAGRILGEVLEKRVQGARPVVLIGSSVGALTILKALLYLSSLPPPSGASSAVPAYVDSAFFISLPSAPTEEEWANCRRVVARRLVNAYSDADFVLAGVVRLHEVVSRAATLSNGIKVAGLGPVAQPGVQDIDVSSVLRGHMELQTKMGDVLRLVDVDA